MSAYQQLLQHFCCIDKEHSSYTVLQKPFIDRGFIIATDGLGCIFLSEQLYNNHDYPTYTNYTNTAFDGIINLWYQEFSHYIVQQCDELKTDPLFETFACKECEGKGMVNMEYKHSYYDRLCPECGGSGGNIKKHPSKKDYPEQTVIKIHEAFVSAELFDKYILHTANVLQADTITLVSYRDSGKPIAFKVGKCVVLIAPLKDIKTSNLELFQSPNFLQNPLKLFSEITLE